MGTLALLVFGPKLGETVAGWVGLGRVFTVVWNVVSIPVVVLLVMIGVALVYYFAPSTEQHWRWVTPGSAVAIVLWLALSFGLRFYVTNFASYNTTYGSIGGVILLVLWLYLSSLALLLGAEVNSEIEHAAARRGAADAKEAGTRTTGALAHQQPGRLHAVPGRGRVQSVTDGLGRLARLEVELALAETRSTARSGAVAIGVAVVAAVSALTGLVVLLAAALAPAFQADWRPLVVAGGGGALLGAAGLAWAAYRLRNLDLWRATVASLKENREWAERRLRYATRSPSRAAS